MTARNRDSRELIVQLRQQLAAWQGASATPSDLLSTGCQALDKLLPQNGLRSGSLVEWVGIGPASGAGTVSLGVAQRWARPDRPLVVVDGQRQVYPLALAAQGADLAALVIVMPRSEREALWACEEALRSQVVSGVWVRVDRLSPLAFRRLQLAAEASSAVGCLVRPEAALRQPTWAEVRLGVAPQPGIDESPVFRVELLHPAVWGQPRAVVLEMESHQGTLHEARTSPTLRVVSPVANPAPAQRPTGT